MNINDIKGKPIVLIGFDKANRQNAFYLTETKSFDCLDEVNYIGGNKFYIPDWIINLPHLRDVFSRPFIQDDENKDAIFVHYTKFKCIPATITEKHEIIWLINLIPDGLYEALDEVGAYIGVKDNENRLTSKNVELLEKIKDQERIISELKSNIQNINDINKKLLLQIPFGEYWALWKEKND